MAECPCGSEIFSAPSGRGRPRKFCLPCGERKRELVPFEPRPPRPAPVPRVARVVEARVLKVRAAAERVVKARPVREVVAKIEEAPRVRTCRVCGETDPARGWVLSKGKPTRICRGCRTAQVGAQHRISREEARLARLSAPPALCGCGGPLARSPKTGRDKPRCAECKRVRNLAQLREKAVALRQVTQAGRVCASCPASLVGFHGTRLYCDACAAARFEERAVARLVRGARVCACGAPIAVGRMVCDPCILERRREKGRQYARRHAKALYERSKIRLAQKRGPRSCESCGADVGAHRKQFCSPCRAERKRAQRQAQYARRKSVGQHRRVFAAGTPEHAAYLGRLREWRAANPEYRREWVARGGEAVEAGKLAKKARKAKTKRRIAPSQIAWIFAAQKGRCAYCRDKLVTEGPRKYHLDHIIPIAAGGEHAASNLQAACFDCNVSKGAKDPVVFAQSRGLLL